jgi:hypothetical protein
MRKRLLAGIPKMKPISGRKNITLSFGMGEKKILSYFIKLVLVSAS